MSKLVSAVFATFLLTMGLSAWVHSHRPAQAEAIPVLTSSIASSATNWPMSTASLDAHTDERTDFEKAAAASVNAVVHVQTTSIVQDYSNPWMSMLGMPQGRMAHGSGSGVVIASEGVIVTNHHVIADAREVWVNTSDGATCQAKVIGSDPSTDLAVLKINPQKPLQAIPIGNSDEVQVGQWVLAVGNPLNLTSTVTAGIISAKGRNIQLLEPNAHKDIYPVESFLQTDAAVNPGNSGGALVNLDGELIGINTAIASQTGSYAGYSFAIPTSIVAKVAEDLMEFGRVQRAFLGVKLKQEGNDLKVESTLPGGGAIHAGIQPGDQILSVNGTKVNRFPMLQEQLSKYRPNDEVELSVKRGAKVLDIPVKLVGKVNARTAQEKTVIPSQHWLKEWGVSFESLSDEEKERLDIRHGVSTRVEGLGEWKRQGLRSGFVVVRVDGAPVDSEQEIESALHRAAEDGETGVLIEGIYPDGSRSYVGVAIPGCFIQPHN